MDIQTFERRKSIWLDSLMLPYYKNLIDSAIMELSEYFSISAEEVINILPQSEKILAEEWVNMNINKKDRNSVIHFYNNTKMEILELMNFHINRFEKGPVNYVCAMEMAKKLGLRKYLDYGSGIGSGAIIFLKNGFDVTCADISQPLLSFIEYRLRKRNLKARLLDLKMQQLDKETYDIITCFEVLEHSTDPLNMLKDLRKALKTEGILILNNVQGVKENHNKPMHISNVNLQKRLRSLGFEYLWELNHEFKKSCKNNYIFVLRKVNRPFLIDSTFYLYDDFPPLYIKTIINKLRRKLKYFIFSLNKSNNKSRHYLFLRKLSSTSGYGGCEKRLLEWFKAIDYQRFKITLAVFKEAKHIFLEKIKLNNLNIDVIDLPSTFKNKSFKNFFNMLFFLKKIKPTDVVYIEGGFGQFSLTDVLAGYLYTIGNTYITVHLSPYGPPKKISRYHLGFIPGLGLWWYIQFYKKKLYFGFRAYLAKRILAVSNEVKQKLVKWYGHPQTKIFIGYHGVDTKIFSTDVFTKQIMRREFKIKEDDIVLISASRLVKVKCLHRLINAFDTVYQEFKNSWLFLLGDGPLRNELEELANLKLSKARIKFLGFKEDVSPYLKMSDIFVLPSDIEGFGNATLEAMSTGLICIRTKTAGADEVIKDGINGFLVENTEQGVMYGLIKALSFIEEERKKISNNAIKFVKENFAIKKRVTEQLKILGIT